MTKPGDVSYIVLTECEDKHHVVLRRRGSEWLQTVATFLRRDRAQSFAEVENDMMEDDVGFHEPKESPPTIPAPDTSMMRLTETIRESRVTSEIRREISGTPSQHSTIADEIVAALPRLVEEFPKGPTAKILSLRLSLDEHHVRRAMRDIEKAGSALVVSRKDSSSRHVIPLDYEPPEEELTNTQSAVLGVMSAALGPDGICQITKRDIADRACVSNGTIDAVMHALEHKGRLEVISRGVGTDANRYRVLPVRSAAA